MQLLLRNSQHGKEFSHDFFLYEEKGKKIKTVYEARNALEHCNTYIFDGATFNLVLSLWDLGVKPDSSIFLETPEERKKRAESFLEKTQEIIKLMLKC